MNIFHVSSEVFPYSKTGGLADMTAALAKAQAGAGHEVTLLTPLYRGIRDQFEGIKLSDTQLSVPLGQARWLRWEMSRQPRRARHPPPRRGCACCQCPLTEPRGLGYPQPTEDSRAKLRGTLLGQARLGLIEPAVARTTVRAFPVGGGGFDT